MKIRVHTYISLTLLLVFFFPGRWLFAQEKKTPAITPYTIETTYSKLKKHYPDITPIQPVISDSVLTLKNLTYRITPTSNLKLDVCMPTWAPDEKFPVVLLVHGGGWISGSKENQLMMAQHLAKKGYIGIAVAYRLSTEAPYPAAVLDIKSALQWIRNHADEYHADGSKIAILGASAGAQLATLVGVTGNNPLYDTGNTTNTAVQAIVNVDGIVSFIHPDAEEGEIAGLWLGGSKEENPTNWKEASPLEYVSDTAPPTLFINSSMPRFHAGRDDMVQKLNTYHIYSEVHTLDGSPHSFWLMHPWFLPTVNYTVVFLDKILKSNP